MHILRDKKKTKGGKTRTYVALAQSVWERTPEGKGRSKPVISRALAWRRSWTCPRCVARETRWTGTCVVGWRRRVRAWRR
jgi:hypothetical protein